jgi:hypothetical protein
MMPKKERKKEKKEQRNKTNREPIKVLTRQELPIGGDDDAKWYFPFPPVFVIGSEVG